ncbi:MAG: MerR family DNA-binding transcriptional regulator [Rubrivivax sp.]|nr:MerR family DNA-binding transcriptional regulator [Rubrivivax sp.]MCA3257530.1 MerR family DNA-binding transcriptional regulator [Rubrivivax sp.]
MARPAAPGSAAGGGGPRSAAASAQEVVASHRDDGTGELFGITELCREFGITLRTIRFYEDKGLLAPRRVNGTRVYTRRDRARLALILRSKAIGASLAEIKHYLDLYGAGGEGRVQQLKYVLQRTDAAIDALEQKRAHIEATLAELRVINAEVRKQLDAR